MANSSSTPRSSNKRGIINISGITVLLLLLAMAATVYFTASNSTITAQAHVPRIGSQAVYGGAYGTEVVANLSDFKSTLLSTVMGDFDTAKPNLKGFELYGTLGPIVTCPPHMPLSRYGNTGDGGKLLCDVTQLPSPCLIYSLGSAGDYSFEMAMLKETKCDIHTFDCTYDGKSQDPTRHFYHKWCVGGSGAPGFKSWDDITAALGHQGQIMDVLKFDIEGYEAFVMAELRHNRPLPRQVSVEIHMIPLAPAPKTRSQLAFMMMHMASLGYAIVSQENNVVAPGECCAEWTFLLVELPSLMTGAMQMEQSRQK